MKKGSGRRRERTIPEQDQEQDDTLGAATTCWWHPQHQKSLPVKARKREKTGKTSIKCGILSAEKGFQFHTHTRANPELRSPDQWRKQLNAAPGHKRKRHQRQNRSGSK